MKAVGPVGTRPEKQPINYGEGDYSMDRMAAIRRLAEEQEALIAAHTYQTPEIQDAADIVGDSYALAKKAADSQARSVYMCGCLLYTSQPVVFRLCWLAGTLLGL